ncbi:MAG: penicillin acylase family protein [Kibdelosporangium sp.]
MLTTFAVSLALVAGALPAVPSSATIRFTEYDIPHIVARDYRSLGHGQGYAAARANLCAIADGVITLRGERSRHFGPGPNTTALNRSSDNLSNDLYYQSFSVEPMLGQATPDVRQMVKGYVTGYNSYLAQKPPNNCAAPLMPMTELDVYRRVHAWSTAMVSGSSVDAIVNAAPGATPPAGRPMADMSGPGSNAIALGRDATASKRGIVVLNPHLPWDGDMGWDMVQLTIPGRFNVSGATFVGLPFVVGGMNGKLSWSGTIADAVVPGTLFELKLTGPTTYLVDGKPEQMRRNDVTVQVKQPDGTLEPVTKTQFSTRYGPVLTNFRGVALPWTADKAYALGDANAGNMRFLNMLSQLGESQNVDEFIQTMHRTQGNPIFNLMAADSAGHTVYTGQTTIPNVPDPLAAECNTALGQQTFPAMGLAVLDGSRTACSWRTDKDAIVPGILGPGNLPELRRDDYVSNSNQSYWLTNARQPMRKLPRIAGDFETARNVRTRDTLTEITENLGEFDLKSTQDLVFSNRVYAAELALDETIAMCRRLELGQACDVLARWDRKANVDSRGYLLFSRFWGRVGRSADWKVPFSVQDPVRTPRTLNTDNPVVEKALADAVADMNAANIPLDAPVGDHQYVEKDGKRIPIGGGRPETGTFNVIASNWDNGYHGIGQGRSGTNSSGYVRVTEFNGTPCPDARAVLAYKQPELFSQKQWITERFCEKDILASPSLKVVHLRTG